MTKDGKLVYCYNKGCKVKQFDPENNPPNSEECVFHPGAPYFHDAMKIWSCCNKKSHDFTEFLDIRGCKTGPHNPTKPEEPVKQKAVDSAPEKIGQPVVEPAKRECPKVVESRLVDLPITVTPALQEQLKKLSQESQTKPENACDSSVPEGAIEKGASCKNRGCNKTFMGEDDHNVDDVKLSTDDPEDEEAQTKTGGSRCVYHPGVPVFHEG